MFGIWSMPAQDDAIPLEALPIEALPIEALPIEALPIEALPIEALPIDSAAVLFLVQVDPVQVAFFQGIFESYEGVGLVRTLDIQRSLLGVLTTPDMQLDCLRLLKDIWPVTKWTAVQCISGKCISGQSIFPESASPQDLSQYINFFK
jgi:hypothetical protein